MAKPQIEVIGNESLKKAIDRLRASGRDGMGEAVLAGAYIIEGEAKKLAPVDTGALRASIASRHETTALSGLSATAIVEPGVHYAEFVERGTSRMAAQPYLRPAADNNHRAVEAAAITTLARAIEGVI